MNLQHILNEHNKWLNGKGGERANLSGANLCYADLSDANLSGADLRYVDLQYANLRKTNLRGTALYGANLWGTTGNMREIKSLQLAVYPIAYTATHLQIGCENHLIQKWWEFTEDEIYDMDGQKALAFWRKYKDHIRATIELAPAVKS